MATARTETTESATNSSPEAAIRTLFHAVDQRDWGTAQAVLAHQLQVDYSDLGGANGPVTAEELIGGWKPFLSGFDRTLHQPHRIAVWPTGDRATATADGIAVHLLDDDQWAVFAGYDFELLRDTDGQWKIAFIRLSLYHQTGNLRLGAEAHGRQAAADVTSPHADRIATFFETLENRDLDGLVALFAEDGRQLMPLSPDGFPREVDGRENIRELYTHAMNFTSMAFEYETLATPNPDLVAARFTGTVNVSPGQPYNNSYIGVWQFNDAGEITAYTEYFNPMVLQYGFPGLQPPHYSVHASGAAPKDGVELREIAFDSRGDRLVGHLFLPPDFDETRTYPAVLVAGSWTSVKEQMPDTYASRLAEDGFITLTFDFRGFGESEGQPRQYENAERKIQDVRAAADFLKRQPNVGDAIAGLGVCAGAGYVAHAVNRDDRFTHLALVAPWLHDPAVAAQIYASRPGGVEALLASAEVAAARYADTGQATFVAAASELDPLAAMYVPNGVFPYYLSPAKAAGPHYDNRFAVQSWASWLNFDAFAAADGLTKPVCIVHSEKGAIPDGARRFIERLPGETPTITWLNDYTQEQIYYEDDAVTAAMNATSAWLKDQTRIDR
ncbi:MAG: alpha/beta fold hydrolase [Planctomycetota bacterium]